MTIARQPRQLKTLIWVPWPAPGPDHYLGYLAVQMTVTHAQVTSLLSECSIEITPTSAAKIENLATHLIPGTKVNVTFLPGSSFADTIDVCERLHHGGYIAVPHLAARSLENAAQLERHLEALANRAGISTVLVIGGSVDRLVGTFDNTIQILKSGLLEKHGIQQISIAGHPEGSPDIDDRALAKALAEKNAWARDTDTEVFIKTQFCFEARTIAAWGRWMLAEGNQLPIHVGVPGLATLKTLIRYAQTSGVGPSIRVLTRQARNIAKLLVVQEPDILVAGLAQEIATNPDSLITNVHFYPFGGLAKTAAWANAAASGAIRPKPKGGFELLDHSSKQIRTPF